VEATIAEFHRLKQEAPDTHNFAESELNRLGYQLLHHGKGKEAIAIFKLNVEVYPTSANAYDSLADGYLAGDEPKLAMECYEKVLELLPNNRHYAEEFRRQLESKARERLKGR